jgi:hypothetical protein
LRMMMVLYTWYDWRIHFTYLLSRHACYVPNTGVNPQMTTFHKKNGTW